MIYIHSSGRFNPAEHKTLKSLSSGSFSKLPKSVSKNVRLVIQAAEVCKYFDVISTFGVDCIPLPEDIRTLSPTRQWLLENHPEAVGKYITFLDDDLLFFSRREDDPTKFLMLGGAGVMYALHTLENRLKKTGYIHGGLLAREGGNRFLDGDKTCMRMMRVLTYKYAEVLKEGARFDRVPSKQDFDMTLQLLRAGYPNLVIADFVQGQYGAGCSNAPGGCSVYRTADMNEKSGYDLARLHPGFVKVVEKSSKTSWGGERRVDVNVQWKKAYGTGGGV